MRIALLADIHGNLPALEAVLAELDRLQPDQVVVDGDLINGVPFSPEVIDRVRALDWAVVRGNHEFYYLDFGTARDVYGSHDRERWGQLHWLVERITPTQGAYLAMLPDERTFYLPGAQPVRITHGVPGRNRVGFYAHQPAEQIIADIYAIPERTLISAHSHVQVDRHLCVDPDLLSRLQSNPHLDGLLNEQAVLPRDWHVINPGSVGLPLGGNPAAHFALLENVPESVAPGGWRATMQQVAYDRRPALAAFAETGMLSAGGVITQLFYWEVVTAQPEIIFFYRWAREYGFDPEHDIGATFRAYMAATQRDAYVRDRDPLYQRAHN